MSVLLIDSRLDWLQLSSPKSFSQSLHHSRMATLPTLFELCHLKSTSPLKHLTLKYNPHTALISKFIFTSTAGAIKQEKLQIYGKFVMMPIFEFFSK